MGKGPGNGAGSAAQPPGDANTARGQASSAEGPPGAAYAPPQLTLPPDGPYGPDPHGRKGPAQVRRTHSRTSVVVASVCGALVLCCTAAVALSATANMSAPVSTVGLPRSLDGGKLTLTRDFSDEPGLALRSKHRTSAQGLKPVAGQYEGLEPVGGQYEGAPRNGGKPDDRLTVRAYNGTTLRPETTVHDLLTTLEGDEASAGERRRITPRGGEGPLTCEVMLKDRTGGDEGVVEVPVCAWSDKGSVGAVLDHGPSVRGSYGSDLDAFAGRVDSIRAEVGVKRIKSGSET